MLLYEQGGLPAEMIALDLQETGAPQKFGGGKGAAVPSLLVHATHPLGETFRWVMKAYLQRAYIGVHEKRVVQEKVKESCQDRLRLIRLVPGD